MTTPPIPTLLDCGCAQLRHEFTGSVPSGPPSVFMGDPKEPNYSATDFPMIREVQALSEYLEVFPSDDAAPPSVVGEA